MILRKKKPSAHEPGVYLNKVTVNIYGPDHVLQAQVPVQYVSAICNGDSLNIDIDFDLTTLV